MNCIFAIEGRFVLNNGRPASTHLSYDRLWTRYLQVFDSVTVLGRLFPIETPGLFPVEGPGVSFFPLPGYTGPGQFLRNFYRLTKLIKSACSQPAAVILRGGNIAYLTWREIRKIKHPFGLEVTGDPNEVFAPGAINHLLRPLFRSIYPKLLRQICREATAVQYVTDYTLQHRYPCSNFSVGVSDVDLPDEAFVHGGRPFDVHKKSFTIITIASLAQLYKAPDVLIDSVKACLDRGINVNLFWSAMESIGMILRKGFYH